MRKEATIKAEMESIKQQLVEHHESSRTSALRYQYKTLEWVLESDPQEFVET